MEEIQKALNIRDFQNLSRSIALSDSSYHLPVSLAEVIDSTYKFQKDVSTLKVLYQYLDRTTRLFSKISFNQILNESYLPKIKKHLKKLNENKKDDYIIILSGKVYSRKILTPLIKLSEKFWDRKSRTIVLENIEMDVLAQDVKDTSLKLNEWGFSDYIIDNIIEKKEIRVLLQKIIREKLSLGCRVILMGPGMKEMYMEIGEFKESHSIQAIEYKKIEDEIHYQLFRNKGELIQEGEEITIDMGWMWVIQDFLK